MHTCQGGEAHEAEWHEGCRQAQVCSWHVVDAKLGHGAGSYTILAIAQMRNGCGENQVVGHHSVILLGEGFARYPPV